MIAREDGVRETTVVVRHRKSELVNGKPERVLYAETECLAWVRGQVTVREQSPLPRPRQEVGQGGTADDDQAGETYGAGVCPMNRTKIETFRNASHPALRRRMYRGRSRAPFRVSSSPFRIRHTSRTRRRRIVGCGR